MERGPSPGAVDGKNEDMKKEYKIAGDLIRGPDGSSYTLGEEEREALKTFGEDIREALRARLGLSDNDTILKFSHNVERGEWTTTVEMTRSWPEGLM